MGSIGFQGPGIWVGIFSLFLMVLCFYFTLTFFEYLRKEDERITLQAKIAATICFALALITPILFNYFF